MKIMPTSQTTLEKIKKRAKEIKQEEKISHTAALERSANEFGYTNWHHAQQTASAIPANLESDSLPSQGNLQITNASDPRFRRFLSETHEAYMAIIAEKGANAKIERGQQKKDCFHQVAIDGVLFRGLIGIDCPMLEGPPITLHRRERVDAGDLAICHINDKNINHIKAGWYVCKYGITEPRIDLSALTIEGVCALAYEFGIPIHYSPELAGNLSIATCYSTRNAILFRLSPAFQRIQKWAEAHPTKAKQIPGRWLS